MTTLDISIPLSAERGNYNPETAKDNYAKNAELIADRYHYEKFIGKRSSDGALKLNELKPEHKKYISAYINGMKGVEIAEQFNVAAITVYRVLADPLARDMIEEFDEGFKAEFRAMFPLVSLAVREGLQSESLGLALKSVDRWAKICRLIDGKGDDEDVRKVDSVVAARMRFVQLVKGAQDAAAAVGRTGSPHDTIIEVEATVVEGVL